MYFTYILVCLETRRSYAGHTDDLIRRYRCHLSGSIRTSREKLRYPVVVHWEPFPSRAEAMDRERYFKAGSGHRLKQEIIIEALELFAISR